MIDLQQIQCSCANIINRTTCDINNVGNQTKDEILLSEIESNDEVRKYRNSSVETLEHSNSVLLAKIAVTPQRRKKAEAICLRNRSPAACTASI